MLLALLALAAAGCDGESLDADDARAEMAPLAKRDIDARRGTWRGVGLGATRRQVDRRFGRVRSGRYDPWAPIDALSTSSPPTPAHPPDARNIAFWRGRGFAFAAANGRAYSLLVTARGSKTRAGVGIGDTRAEVRDAYPRFRCGTANEGTEWPEIPYCMGRVARRRHVWFGGDPVDTVVLSEWPFFR